MSYICLHDKSEIVSRLSPDVVLHIYELGDLDDFLFPQTIWFAAGPDAEGRTNDAVVLLYVGNRLPTLLALDRTPGRMAALLHDLLPILPTRFHAHLSSGLADALTPTYRLTKGGLHHKMVLDGDKLPASPFPETPAPSGRKGEHRQQNGEGKPGRDEYEGVNRVVSLGPENLAEVEEFYATAYPENWFDPRMLASGCYYGVRANGVAEAAAGGTGSMAARPTPDGRRDGGGGDPAAGRDSRFLRAGESPGRRGAGAHQDAGGRTGFAALVCVAGVHVYSPQYGVAALGNVATLPAFRGRGLATLVTTRLCRQLTDQGLTVGLNVKSDNTPALAAYTKIGFSVVADYEEFTAERT